MTRAAVLAFERCPGEEVFVDWLDARVGDATMQALDVHLDVCGACRELFAELSRTPRTMAIRASRHRPAQRLIRRRP
jgi:hypothetical protein